jgi:hypothetical protein
MCARRESAYLCGFSGSRVCVWNWCLVGGVQPLWLVCITGHILVGNSPDVAPFRLMCVSSRPQIGLSKGGHNACMWHSRPLKPPVRL